jgi:hypothetical protein
MAHRTDLSNWLIHFVRDRTPENAWEWLGEYDESLPAAFRADGCPVFDGEFWKAPPEPRVEPDADAFAALLNILWSGYIRAWWALRAGKATVYGPRPAVCFTEMPLYASGSLRW